MISRCRSASARMRSAASAPRERNSAATRARSASIRRYTDVLTSGGRSMRLMRTSTISMPKGAAWRLAWARRTSMICERSADTAS